MINKPKTIKASSYPPPADIEMKVFIGFLDGIVANLRARISSLKNSSFRFRHEWRRINQLLLYFVERWGYFICGGVGSFVVLNIVVDLYGLIEPVFVILDKIMGYFDSFVERFEGGLLNYIVVTGSWFFRVFGFGKEMSIDLLFIFCQFWEEFRFR